MIERKIGQRPKFEDIALPSALFMKALLKLEIDEILVRARRINRISRVAAQLCGEKLSLEGNYEEEKTVWITHEYVHSLMRPSLEIYSPDDVERMMLEDETKDTVRKSSGGLSSAGFDRASMEYSKEGQHFSLDDEGHLVFVDKNGLMSNERYAGEGCPYAKDDKTPFHDKVFEKAVKIYAEAHRRDMPENWLDSVKRFIIRK